MHCSFCLLPISSLDKVFKWLVFLSGWSFFHLGDKKVVACCVRQVVVLHSNDCKGIISYSSTKSLVPPIYKFTTRNLDLIFFPFFSLHRCVLNDWSIFWVDGKKLSHQKVVPFCQLFLVRVKKVCYEKKVRGELLG